MQVYGSPAAPDGLTRAGLVLLYAPSYEQFAPAYLLHDRDLIIGREPAAGICIPEAAVSRQHARVHFRDGRWVLIDYIDFVVHVFHPAAREFYQLERLWGDAPMQALEA